MSVSWYVRRLSAMDATEVAHRARDQVVRWRWRARWANAGAGPAVFPVRDGSCPSPLPASAANGVPAGARHRLLAAADGLLAGRWVVFTAAREDMAPAPDWFFDPTTHTRVPGDAYCFDIDIRSGPERQSLKHVWEVSRHQHTTVLAAAYHLSGDERYASAAASQLRAWWTANPPFAGVHWTSAIELGVRLLSWVWIRRLLHGWPAATALFEENPEFLLQLRCHQEYLDAFRSHGTSANNHVLAEAAGQFAASCAFPAFEDSSRWRQSAGSLLERELERQTFPSGLHRELASAYHAFVLELGLAAALEAEASGHRLGADTWELLRRMVDAAAAVVDGRLRPPRQGDDDGGVGLLVDAPDFSRWTSLLATGAALFGPADWWPAVPAEDIRTPLWTALATRRPLAPESLSRHRPGLVDAGTVVLRAGSTAEDELWCRLDHGPHGYLAIAAHAHSDALALEVRAGGVEILADPGTYCYHGNPRWRDYFRSTLGHNTLEVDGCEQSIPEGPFMWRRHAGTRLDYVVNLDVGPVAEWRAAHDGYRRLRPPVTHVRTVQLHRLEGFLEVSDRLETTGIHRCRLAFHLGPAVAGELEGTEASLSWTVDGTRRTATLALPPQLTWQCLRGVDDPPFGWYSPTFGVRFPTAALVGEGAVGGEDELLTVLEFTPVERPAELPTGSGP